MPPIAGACRCCCRAPRCRGAAEPSQPPRQQHEHEPGQRGHRAAGDPGRLVDHEALGRVGKYPAALAHPNKAREHGEQANDQEYETKNAHRDALIVFPLWGAAWFHQGRAAAARHPPVAARRDRRDSGRREDEAVTAGLSHAERDLQQRARAFAQRTVAPRAAAIDRSRDYPHDIVAALAAEGYMGMTIPAELGGQGRSFLEAVLVIEEMARACTVTGRIVVEANMGAISAVMAYGTAAQKRLAAELVLAGDKPAICITEPEAGSDAAAMTTRADRRGDHWVINGTKHWITGAGISKLHLIFARAFDEAGAPLGIAGFLAVSPAAGLEMAYREPTLGLCGMPEGRLELRDLVVPAAMALSGCRFADLINAYNSQRVGAGTVAMGIAAGALDHALAWAERREQFGRRLADFQGLQWMLADMQTQLTASRLMLHAAARSRGPDGSAFPDPMLAAQAKIFASEAALKIVNDALQIFGARGYSKDFPLERMARDVRMFTIAGGTAQVLRTLVASRMLGRKLPQAPGPAA
ncbi:MAG: acyl-CoA dehydrogenase family protein [Rhodospirillales bacterium]|nr:acyl-CoA dehydrogenase family protein [Rhodospirillales bacterium]